MQSLRLMARVARNTRAYRPCSRLPNHLSPASIRPTFISAARPMTAFFSTSILRREGDSINQELAAKLEQEMSLETEIRDHESLPAPLKEYLDNCAFKLVDVPGNEEVRLERTYGDEKITVSFSVSDLNNMDEEDADELGNEDAMMDELIEDPADITDAQSGGANSKGSVNKGRTAGGNFKVSPEDRNAPADREELADEEDMDDMEEDDHEPSFPTHIFVKIERPGKGALQIDTVANDGVIMIENIYHFKDPKHADSDNFSDELASRTLYTGPPFANLDEELQLMFDRYLDERGVNTSLALFVPEFIDYKEQREYMTWLQDLKQFVA